MTAPQGAFWNMTPHPVTVVHEGKVRLSLPRPHGFVRLDYVTAPGDVAWQPHVLALDFVVQWRTRWDGMTRPQKDDTIVVSSLCVAHLDPARLITLARALRPSDGAVVLAAPGHTRWHRGKRCTDMLRVFYHPGQRSQACR